ncbi:MBL fold metallo-hydrolase [Pseudonocardia dioxanivorans]|uniref:MBL fold metallo-hydrolase n=1 Tax=Pseudonocardia dioxanivorans TaxID=240495 RepID=UPI001F4181C7|nr:MBL fold metallo-hydrolase [Pseudonocardia dioxanivorans]
MSIVSRRVVSAAARSVLVGGLLVGAGRVARAARGVPLAVGASDAVLRARAASSPHSRDGRFGNTEPGVQIAPGELRGLLLRLLTRGTTGTPSAPVPIAADVQPVTAGELALTWYGHSSVLLEIDGRRVLTDPVWSERVSPSERVGPRRLHPAPVPLQALPQVDAVVVSHDHYDHLDMATVRRLGHETAAVFVVPVGIGAHLRRWGVPDDRIRELDWNDATEVAGLTITCAEARHFSGRLFARNTTQWSSWAVAGPRRRAYFGGDTGYTAAFSEAGARLGPFDVTVLPVGAYDVAWPDIHMNPEESVRAHRDLRGGLLVPVHWATFNLAFHGWSEPVTRLRAAAETARIPLVVPRPGQRVDLLVPPALDDWWSALG